MSARPDDFAALRTLTVPTLANAVELFGAAPANAGYTTEALRCHFPRLGTMVGRAVTVQATTDRAPGAGPPPIDEPAYWRWIEAMPGPKVVVLQDLDARVAGAMWGEWNAHVHMALGCVGTVTQGAVRDLDALERRGFHAFATAVSVAHGYGVFVGYGEPVSVAGLTVATGDLLVADEHGVLRIPDTVPVDELVEVGRTIDRLESEIFEYCRREDFTVDGLAALEQSVVARWPAPRGDTLASRTR
jgi:4-hydroxy-4-methyl-2-oxoglutarate aldolase